MIKENRLIRCKRVHTIHMTRVNLGDKGVVRLSENGTQVEVGGRRYNVSNVYIDKHWEIDIEGTFRGRGIDIELYNRLGVWQREKFIRYYLENEDLEGAEVFNDRIRELYNEYIMEVACL